MNIIDKSGTPRPMRDIKAALAFVEAEMVHHPTRMGPGNTGPALIHFMAIREVLLEVIKKLETT